MDKRITALVILGIVTLTSTAQDRGFAPRRLVSADLKVPVPQAALDLQYQALAAMPGVEVEYSRFGSVRRLKGPTQLFISKAGRSVQFEQPADEIFTKLRPVLAAKGTEKLIVRSVYEHPDGRLLSLKMVQTIRGLPVVASDAQLEIDTATGEIVSASFFFVPDHGLPTKPRIPAQEAFRVAAEALEATDKAAKGSVTRPMAPTLKYYRPHRKTDAPTLIWEVYAHYRPSNGDVNQQSAIVLVDAIEGWTIDALPDTANAVNWPAWTAFNATPATASFPNGLGLTTDGVASATWLNLAQADQAWADYGLGLTPRDLYLVVHYGSGFTNAGTTRNQVPHWLFFGDGAASGTYQSGPLGQSRDIAAHEYGHSRLWDLKPFNPALREPRAAEEFFADWSAVVADNRWRGVPSTPATFEIGEIYAQRPGVGGRSWNTPAISAIPPTGVDWYPSFREFGDPHSNSTILGLAYRLMVTGGTHPRAGLGGIPPINVTPTIDDATAKAIYIRALQGTQLSIDGDFFQFRKAVENAADAVSPMARTTVGLGFDAVGIGYSCAVPPSKPTLNVQDLMCAGRYFISWPSVPGASRYVAEAVREFYPWSLSSPIVDGGDQSCMVTVRARYWVRLKACNGCGCSPYTEPVTLTYWPGPCP